MTINNICLDDEIPYYEPEEWKKYYKNLYKLYSISKQIYDFRKELSEYENKSLYEVYNSENEFDQTIYRIVMSGFTGNYKKPFKEKSLSRFYYEIYGFGIDEGDAIQLIIEWGGKSYGQKVDAMRVITIKYYENTNLLLASRVKRIYEYLDLFFNYSKYSTLLTKSDKDEVERMVSGVIGEFKDVEHGGKLLELFLNTSRTILPHYSKLSFFIMSLYRNIKLYLEEYYRKLFYDDNIKNIVSKYIEPQEKEVVPGIKGIIIDYPETRIVKTIFEIFRIFSYDALKKYFDGIRNELETYIVESWRILARLDYNSMLKDFLDRICEKESIYELKLEKNRYVGEDIEWIGDLPVPNDFNVIVVKIKAGLKNLSIDELIDLFNVVQPLMMYGLAYYVYYGEPHNLYLLVHQDVIPATLHEHGECGAKGDY